MIELLLLIEIVIVVFVGILHLIEVRKFRNDKVTLKQPDLEKIGRYLAMLGIIIIIIGPSVLDVRYKYDDKSALIYFIAISSGFLVFFVGVKLRLHSYRPKEENPEWLSNLVDYLSVFLGINKR